MWLYNYTPTYSNNLCISYMYLHYKTAYVSTVYKLKNYIANCNLAMYSNYRYVLYVSWYAYAWLNTSICSFIRRLHVLDS